MGAVWGAARPGNGLRRPFRDGVGRGMKTGLMGVSRPLSGHAQYLYRMWYQSHIDGRGQTRWPLPSPASSRQVGSSAASVLMLVAEG